MQIQPATLPRVVFKIVSLQFKTKLYPNTPSREQDQESFRLGLNWPYTEVDRKSLIVLHVFYCFSEGECFHCVYPGRDEHHRSLCSFLLYKRQEQQGGRCAQRQPPSRKPTRPAALGMSVMPMESSVSLILGSSCALTLLSFMPHGMYTFWAEPELLIWVMGWFQTV